MNDKNFVGFILNDWYVFDSFAPFQIEWRGKQYPTAEHAYQAAHFLGVNEELAEQISKCRSPKEAQDLANQNKDQDRPGWKEERLSVMEDIIRAKLTQHPIIQETLRSTGDKMIVEMNDKDEFWGWGRNHDGQNQLGKIWMKLREELI